MTDRQTVVLQAWVFADVFSKMNRVSLSLQGKQLTVFIANDKIQTFKQNSGSGKLASTGLICITEWTKIFFSRQLVSIVSSSYMYKIFSKCMTDNRF